MAARRTAAAGLISSRSTLQLALFGLVAFGAPAVLAQRRMPAPVPSAPAPQTLQPAPQASSPTPLPAPTTLPVVPPGAATPPPSPARLNTGLVTIESDLQRADQSTGVVTATGNVRIVYPDQRVVATARQAQYFSREGRVVLSGDVDIVQEGGSLLRAEQVLYLVDRERLIAIPTPGRQVFSRVRMPQQTAGTAPGMQQP
ncbi:MAG: LptA/OstA family protein [Cyanobium sp.]